MIKSNNEMDFVLLILKSPKIRYNANSIAKQLKISSMGALKIARRLEKENIIVSERLGNAKFYSINFAYAREYIRFLLKREKEQAQSYIKRWINELKKIKFAECVILFGSVLKNLKQSKDIDVLLLTNKKNFSNLKKEIKELNMLNVKKIHPIYQTESDLRENIKKEDKIILNAIKGIIVYNEDKFVKLLEKWAMLKI